MCAATCAISTLVADDAIEGMLWCSAYQTRRSPTPPRAGRGRRWRRCCSPRSRRGPMGARSRIGELQRHGLFNPRAPDIHPRIVVEVTAHLTRCVTVPDDGPMTYPNTQLFINGQWQDAADGRTLPVHNPATGKEIGTVAHARSPTSTARSPPRRKASRPGATSRRPSAARSCARPRRADARARRRDRPLLTQEQGKPLAEAKGETVAAADIIEWFADEGLRVYGRIVPRRTNLAMRQMVIKDPVGPVAAFTPWNFPINQVVRKVAPALAAGCSMLVKAPEETPAAAGRADPRLPGRRPARRRARPGVRRPGRDLQLPDPAPGDPQDHLHRLDAGRQAAGRAGRPAHEARDDGARRPRTGDRRARTPTSRSRSSRWAPPSSATRARSASRPPASWCTRASTKEFARPWPRSPTASRSATA